MRWRAGRAASYLLQTAVSTTSRRSHTNSNGKCANPQQTSVKILRKSFPDCNRIDDRAPKTVGSDRTKS